jgi:hypothetical protein
MGREKADEPAEDGPDFRRLAVRIFFINLAVLAAAYSLYWYWVANAVEVEIAQWIEVQRAAGQRLDFAEYRRGGFPLAVTLSFREVRYAPEANAPIWSYRVEGVTLRHPLLASGSLGIQMRGAHELTLGDGEAATVYAGGFEANGGTLRAGGWLPNGEWNAQQLTLINGTTGRGLRVGQLSMTASGDAAAPLVPEETGYRLSVVADQLTLPGLMALPFGAEIARLAFDAEVKGALRRQPLPAMLDGWREAGGAVDLSRIIIIHGPMIAEGDGTLTLAPGNEPEAAFSFVVEGSPQLIDRLAETGSLDARQAAQLRAFAALAAKTTSDGRSQVRLPLTLQEGIVSVGPIALLTYPSIRLSGDRVLPSRSP